MKNYNNYLVSLYVEGKSGKDRVMTVESSGYDKSEAIQKAISELENDGFRITGWDYCDLVD